MDKTENIPLLSCAGANRLIHRTGPRLAHCQVLATGNLQAFCPGQPMANNLSPATKGTKTRQIRRGTHEALSNRRPGFIGSNFIRFWLTRHPADVGINLDAQTYAGNPANLADLTGNPFYHYIHGDIADPAKVAEAMDLNPDAVINFAAESHVDRSIQAAAPFIRTNVAGVQVLLEAVRRHKTRLFVQISTDEVYGSVASGKSKVTDPLRPAVPTRRQGRRRPGGPGLYQTYRIPPHTRCTNNYGPYCYPEKFRLNYPQLNLGLLPVYGDGYKSDWFYVLDQLPRLELVIQRGNRKIIISVLKTPSPTLVARHLDYFRLPTAYLHVPDRPP